MSSQKLPFHSWRIHVSRSESAQQDHAAHPYKMQRHQYVTLEATFSTLQKLATAFAAKGTGAPFHGSTVVVGLKVDVTKGAFVSTVRVPQASAAQYLVEDQLLDILELRHWIVLIAPKNQLPELYRAR
jgi:hypothetical protein